MPHRLLDLPPFFAHILEASALGLALGWNIVCYQASLIPDADWSKLEGPNGALFAVSIGLIVVWVSNAKATSNRLKREQAAEEARQERADKAEVKNDERHNETRADMKALTERLVDLTAESIKANVLATVAQQNAATQSATVAEEVKELTEVLKLSPCLATLKLRSHEP